jgi:hypothetical protein
MVLMLSIFIMDPTIIGTDWMDINAHAESLRNPENEGGQKPPS